MTKKSQTFVTMKVKMGNMSLEDALTIMDRKCEVVKIIKVYDDQILEHPKNTFTLTRRLLVETNSDQSP